MYVRITYPKFKAWTDQDLFAVGYEVYAYLAGTSTPANTYPDRNCTPGAENAWPVILDAVGEADLYTKQNLKLVLTVPGGDPATPVWSVDYVSEMQTQTYMVSGEDSPGGSTNLYAMDLSGAYTSIPDNFMVVMHPQATSASTFASTVFTGAGLNDMAWGGAYTGLVDGVIYQVEIESSGAPDTIKWRVDGGAWTTGVNITGTEQILSDGLKITFQQTTGHSVGDVWSATMQIPVQFNFDSLGYKVVYKNASGAFTPLDAGDIVEDFPAVMVYSLEQDCWILVNPGSAVSPAHGRLKVVGSGAWVVPTGVTKIWVHGAGAGGGGAITGAPGGGGGGACVIGEQITVVPGETLVFSCGAAGTAGTVDDGGDGGDTTLTGSTSGLVLSLGGGKGGLAAGGGGLPGGDGGMGGDSGVVIGATDVPGLGGGCIWGIGGGRGSLDIGGAGGLYGGGGAGGVTVAGAGAAGFLEITW